MITIPPETPLLPQGETNLLPQGWDPQGAPYVPPSPERVAAAQELDRTQAAQRWEQLRAAPDANYMHQINQLSIQYQELVLYFWPEVFGRVMIEGQPPIASVQQVLDYALHVAPPLKLDNEPAPVVKSEFATAHMDWIKECSARKAWVASHEAEYKRRKEEMRVAVLQWELYVSEARKAYVDARAYPVPARPGK